MFAAEHPGSKIRAALGVRGTMADHAGHESKGQFPGRQSTNFENAALGQKDRAVELIPEIEEQGQSAELTVGGFAKVGSERVFDAKNPPPKS